MAEKKQLIKETNLVNLKKYLYTNKTATKNQMAKVIGISTVTVNALVTELVNDNFFIEGDMVQHKMGRPAIQYHFNDNYHYYLLISMQEIKNNLYLIIRIVNMAGNISYSKTIDFSEMQLSTFLETITNALKQNKKIESIALSFPGKIIEGTVKSSWHSRFNDWQFEHEVQKAFNLPIFIENDANIATIGYCINNNLLNDDINVGIYYPENSMPGICIFSKNQLLVGKNGLAGEAKYLPNLIDYDGNLGFELEVRKLMDILGIYNSVIAPHSFIIYKDFLTQNFLETIVSQNSILNRQPNKPRFYIAEHFDTDIFIGLQWLAMSNTIYYQNLSQTK